MEKIKFDGDTSRWMLFHRQRGTTVIRCERCGLFYKPSLGHRCKKDIAEEIAEKIDKMLI